MYMYIVYVSASRTFETQKSFQVQVHCESLVHWVHFESLMGTGSSNL